MTKKQKKQLAQKIASLERIVQKNEDPIKVDEAKSQIMKISESADMDYDEMVEIDEMVYNILSEKTWLFSKNNVEIQGLDIEVELNIEIDTNIEEPVALITTPRMTEEVTRVVDFISKLDDITTVISGIRDDKVELLEQESIFRIYAEEGKVLARTESGLYQIRLRLYELEERLDDSKFVRISNSEIVNLKKVKSLDLSFVGTICMELSNGEVSYVSRRYVSKIKKKLGLWGVDDEKRIFI